MIASETPASALQEIADWLGAGVHEISLSGSDGPGLPIAQWRRSGAQTRDVGTRSLLVPGDPEWQLTFRAEQSRLGDPELAWAGESLVAWREAQRELGRAESRLALRTRELDLLQSLGSRAAEARSPFDLFQSTLAVLEQGEPFDLALVAHALDGEPEVAAFLSRPLSEACLEAVQKRATRWLGWPEGDVGSRRKIQVDTYDAERDGTQSFQEQDLVLLPILRRERAVACLVIAPTGRAEGGQLRLLYSAANQLCLHLDRILTVREAEADRFRSILDSMPQAVLLADGEQRVVQANRSAEQLFESLGLALSGGLEPLMERMGLDRLLQPVMDGESEGVDAEAAVDGDRVFNVTVSPGTAFERGTVLVFSDVTESRRLQLKLAQSEKMSSLGQMISGVAHELNNPLTSILGYVQLVAMSQTTDKGASRLELLQREAERCQKIVQNLLSFARRRDPEWKRLSLNEVTRSVLALLGYQLRVDDITVETDLATDLPALDGESHQLQQMLVNLLTNAQHAIRSTSRCGKIMLRTRREAGFVVLEIEDNGPGIPPELRAKIFDPFFTTKDEGKGTGLGLSLVFGIVEAHRGTIEATSGALGGAMFRLRIPEVAAAAGKKTARSESPQSDAVKPGRILVVDDEVALAQMISDLLRADGHQPAIVHGATEALDRLAVEEFDLIISDIKMPGMDGEGLYEKIRSEYPRMTRRLLLTTGDTVGDETDGIARRTGLPVLHKPFDPEHLRREVLSRLRTEG